MYDGLDPGSFMWRHGNGGTLYDEIVQDWTQTEMDFFQYPLTKEIHFSLLDGHMWVDLNPECTTDSFMGGCVL